MNHAGLYSLEQRRSSFRVGPLSSDAGVDVRRRTDTVFRVQNKQKVDVWQPSFLKLDDIQVRGNSSKHVFFDDVLEKLTDFEFKDTCHEVGTIVRRLSREQLLLYFIPCRVGGHCNKEVNIAEKAGKCHGILVSLTKITRIRPNESSLRDRCKELHEVSIG